MSEKQGRTKLGHDDTLLSDVKGGARSVSEDFEAERAIAGATARPSASVR